MLLLAHALLGQLAVQLVDAPVGVRDQRVQVVGGQLPSCRNTAMREGGEQRETAAGPPRLPLECSAAPRGF